MQEQVEELFIEKLTRAQKGGATGLERDAVRFLVKGYYDLQGVRMASSAQRSQLVKTDKNTVFVDWLLVNAEKFESEFPKLLAPWVKASVLGQWLQSVCGIGTILAAGLMSEIDITRATSPSAIWRYAGLDPTLPPNKRGEKRHYNADLRVLCYKIGESFVKVQNNEKDFYGGVYAARKALEISRNQSGALADQATAALEKKNWTKNTVTRKAYESGILPDAHIHARARRYAVKLFLSHYWEVAYEVHYGQPPAIQPYVLAHLGHKDRIAVPNWPLVEKVALAA